jgi:hypothetical protein
MRATAVARGRVRITGAALLVCALAACGGDRGRPFLCTEDGTPAGTIRVLYEEDSVRLNFGRTTLRLPRVPSASGTRYARGDVEWFAKGDEGLLSRGGQTTGCRLRG